MFTLHPAANVDYLTKSAWSPMRISVSVSLPNFSLQTTANYVTGRNFWQFILQLFYTTRDEQESKHPNAWISNRPKREWVSFKLI